MKFYAPDAKIISLHDRLTRIITWLLHHLWSHRKCENFNFKHAYRPTSKLYTYGRDRQQTTSASTVKWNYFRFATITLNFMHRTLL